MHAEGQRDVAGGVQRCHARLHDAKGTLSSSVPHTQISPPEQLLMMVNAQILVLRDEANGLPTNPKPGAQWATLLDFKLDEGGARTLRPYNPPPSPGTLDLHTLQSGHELCRHSNVGHDLPKQRPRHCVIRLSKIYRTHTLQLARASTDICEMAQATEGVRCGRNPARVGACK